jgi:hypothetical protein
MIYFLKDVHSSHRHVYKKTGNKTLTEKDKEIQNQIIFHIQVVLIECCHKQCWFTLTSQILVNIDLTNTMWAQISIVFWCIFINCYGKNVPFYVLLLYAAIFWNVTLALAEDLLYMNIKIHQIQSHLKFTHKITRNVFLVLPVPPSGMNSKIKENYCKYHDIKIQLPCLMFPHTTFF